MDLAVGVSDARACRAVLVRFLKVTAQALSAGRSRTVRSAQHSYFIVRNPDSAYALSLLTRDLEKDDATPSSANLAASVNERMGAPLSECSTVAYLPR